jgi:3'(2'), 5'-bisphosphate nucleotidase
MSPSDADADLARRLAIEAGQLLMELHRSGPADAKALGDVADKASNDLLMTALRRERPDDAILSEEEADDRSRLGARRVWLVDPLDGTREYGERRHDWAVHVALSIDGRIADGAVAQPALGQCFCTAHPPALLLPQRPPQGPLRIAVSRSRPASIATKLADAIGAVLVPMGSAGVKTLAVLRGEADVYLHQGDMYEWDSGAPAAVAQAAGLAVSHLDGRPLLFNQARPITPDVLICHRSVQAELLAAVARLQRG